MKILCATDLLPESDAAAERAVIIARQLRAQCYLVHIVGSERDERTAHTALVQIGNRLGVSTVLALVLFSPRRAPWRPFGESFAAWSLSC